jgi:hypothetical protein
MADFCRPCNIKYFDADISDFSGISTEEDTKNGLYARVLCETCGFIYVNHLGERVDINGTVPEKEAGTLGETPESTG